MTLQALSELFPRDDSWNTWRSEAEAVFRELGVESSRAVPLVSLPETAETSRP